MKLYLISQEANDDYGTYDKAVVAAPDEATARTMHPDGGVYPHTDGWYEGPEDDIKFFWTRALAEEFEAETPANIGHVQDSWASHPDQVTVVYLGEADHTMPQSVICASFHAG